MFERISAPKWSTLGFWAAIAGVLAVLPFLFPGLQATTAININDSQAAEAVLGILLPIFRIVRWGIIVVCVILALWKGFKASRGEGGEWKNVVILLLAAAIFAIPAQVMSLLGLGQSLGCYVNMLTASTTGDAVTIYNSVKFNGSCG